MRSYATTYKLPHSPFSGFRLIFSALPNSLSALYASPGLPAPRQALLISAPVAPLAPAFLITPNTSSFAVVLNFFRRLVFLAPFVLPVVFIARRGRPRRLGGLIPRDPNAASMSSIASK